MSSTETCYKCGNTYGIMLAKCPMCEANEREKQLKDNEIRRQRQISEKNLREKTHIGIKHHLGNAYGGAYYEQEHYVNCKPNEITINDIRYNDEYAKLYRRVVDLLHQILYDGSHIRQNDGVGDFMENFEWYESLEAEASVLLDELNE